MPLSTNLFGTAKAFLFTCIRHTVYVAMKWETKLRGRQQRRGESNSKKRKPGVGSFRFFISLFLNTQDMRALFDTLRLGEVCAIGVGMFVCVCVYSRW